MIDFDNFSAPHFWNKRTAVNSTIPELLFPFSVFYYLYNFIKEKRTKRYKLPIPIICVGNATVGGAGKTPVALALGRMLLAQGKKPAFINRGYGGSTKEAVHVDLTRHSADEVGDEALLLARVAPTYVSERRIGAGKLALAEGADILIMDDGLQHFALQKDFSFLVIDGAYGFGNNYILPAGPLREPPHRAAARANAVILIGEDAEESLPKLKRDIPLINARIIPDPAWHEAHAELKEKKLIPFAGLGRPQKFFNMLDGLGYDIDNYVPFPDHYSYTAKDIQELSDLAASTNAVLATTEKDAVKLPADFLAQVIVIPALLQFQDEADVLALLKPYYS